MRARISRAGALGARAFTLVELLVVIGIIALLIAILLPVLGKARESANTVKCAANLRSIGQGIGMYAAEFKQTFPAAYLYQGQKVDPGGPGIEDDSQGYVHWSSYLFKGKVGANDDPSLYRSLVGWDMFTCPSIENGGLPATNPTDQNREPGQESDAPGVIDQQAPRMAYTGNEAVLARNKFYIGFQGAKRAYQFVRAGQVRDSANVVLATEWNNNWHVVSDTGRVNPDAQACKSHRPVSGFKSKSGGIKFEEISPGLGGGGINIYRDRVDDVLAEPPGPGQQITKTLDWVGRNHGTGKPGQKKTNFLYVDGHVETKHVRETIDPIFQWGQTMYSLANQGDVEQP
jgi:prepilin-type N-terminal cleavage/methylation domain-containing protein/prepilin-type processing-associated H-X9-DG protein